MNDSTLFDLIPAYALGALSDDERAQVEAFLTESEEARTELRLYQAMLTGMATTVPPRKAPAHLTDDFRQRLSAGPAIIPIAPRQISRTRWLTALAAILVVAIGLLFVLRSTQTDTNQQVIQQILNDGSATKVALLPKSSATGSITFVSVPSGKQAVLNAQLPPLPDQQQYQLWYIKGSQPDPSVTFDGTQNTTPVLVPAPDPSKGYDTVAITVEPRGGSKAPTNPPIFVGTLS
jgi:anti-sigma-K factor RskA